MADPLNFIWVPIEVGLELDVRQSEHTKKSGKSGEFFETVNLRVYLHGRERFDEDRKWLIDLEKFGGDAKFTAEEIADQLHSELQSFGAYFVCTADSYKGFAKIAAAKANVMLSGLSTKPLPESSPRSRVSQAVLQLLS